jgi:hypothetical protein
MFSGAPRSSSAPTVRARRVVDRAVQRRVNQPGGSDLEWRSGSDLDWHFQMRWARTRMREDVVATLAERDYLAKATARSSES